jgi:hypothetical protein
MRCLTACDSILHENLKTRVSGDKFFLQTSLYCDRNGVSLSILLLKETANTNATERNRRCMARHTDNVVSPSYCTLIDSYFFKLSSLILQSLTSPWVVEKGVAEHCNDAHGQ